MCIRVVCVVIYIQVMCVCGIHVVYVNLVCVHFIVCVAGTGGVCVCARTYCCMLRSGQLTTFISSKAQLQATFVHDFLRSHAAPSPDNEDGSMTVMAGSSQHSLV